jgi:hypothetical protein
LAHDLEGLLAISTAGQHLEVGFLTQEERQTLEDRGVIICED